MTDKTLRVIGELMDSVRPVGSFAARGTGAAEDLVLEVDGVGPIGFPVTAAQGRQLCEVARPARYGLREQTLLDASVRDTWEVPRERVTVRWRDTLLPMLDVLRAELGLMPGCELSAELHSMLVYGPGQFFASHQDSEKSSGMIGTLVVTLPAAFSGGELVIEQHGTKVTDRGSPEELGFVAFYADCRHEVLPVVDGFRITLTYNLLVTGRTGPDAAAFATHPSVASLAEQLRAHFTTPVELPPGPVHRKPGKRPPHQLVYLMDHQYSQHGFGWDRLKGADAVRAGVMVAAGEVAGYDTSLALVEVRDCYAEDYTSWMLIYRQRWERVADGWKCVESADMEIDEDGEPEPVFSDPASLPVVADLPLAPGSEDLGELCWSSVTTTWLIDRSGAAGEPAVPEVWDEELCRGTAKSAVEPFASEIEGYMGNEGNTADFWYRRAAVVVRPRR